MWARGGTLGRPSSSSSSGGDRSPTNCPGARCASSQGRTPLPAAREEGRRRRDDAASEPARVGEGEDESPSPSPAPPSPSGLSHGSSETERRRRRRLPSADEGALSTTTAACHADGGRAPHPPRPLRPMGSAPTWRWNGSSPATAAGAGRRGRRRRGREPMPEDANEAPPLGPTRPGNGRTGLAAFSGPDTPRRDEVTWLMEGRREGETSESTPSVARAAGGAARATVPPEKRERRSASASRPRSRARAGTTLDSIVILVRSGVRRESRRKANSRPHRSLFSSDRPRVTSAPPPRPCPGERRDEARRATRRLACTRSTP